MKNIKMCCKCGNEVSEESFFCPNCGQAIEQLQDEKEEIIAKKNMGKVKYIPLVCIIIYYIIGISHTYGGISVYFHLYPMWWINLMIPIIFAFSSKISDKNWKKTFFYVKRIAKIIIYVEIIFSLCYLVYEQFYWIQMLGEFTYWAYYRIPAFPMFSQLYFFLESFIWGYKDTYSLWQFLGEFLCLVSYISAYYLSKYTLGELEKINLKQFISRHKKLFFFTMGIICIVIIRLFVTKLLGISTIANLQENVLYTENLRCSAEMQNACFEDSKVQIDDVIYIMDGSMSVKEVVSKIENSNMNYIISHGLDSLVSADEQVKVIVYKDGYERFSFTVHNSGENICTLQECELAGFDLQNISDYSNIWYAYGIAADGSNLSYDNIESYFEGYIEHDYSNDNQSNYYLVDSSDNLEYRLEIWTDYPMCCTKYSFYINKSTATGSKVTARSSTLFMRVTMTN